MSQVMKIFFIIGIFNIVAISFYVSCLYQYQNSIFLKYIQTSFNKTETFKSSPSVNCSIPDPYYGHQVIFYRLSADPNYHHEFRYELHGDNRSTNESNLILMFTGKRNKCLEWWDYAPGAHVLSTFRSNNFSILAICTPRDDYDYLTSIQNNRDIQWIYKALQLWMHHVYLKYFHYYPKLYTFSLSRGTYFVSLLCKVIPIQAQIQYVGPGYMPALLKYSDFDEAFQNRLQLDYRFASWYYFDYCFHDESNSTEWRCPLNPSKNYYHPVPPTFFIHHDEDIRFFLPEYHFTIDHLRKYVIHEKLKLLSHVDAFKLRIAHPIDLTNDFMGKYFLPWACKPWFSEIFYEHYTNPIYATIDSAKQTCRCASQNLLYFSYHENVTKTWTQEKRELYTEYVSDIKKTLLSFCAALCGHILTGHSMGSHYIEESLDWVRSIEKTRMRVFIEDSSSRSLRLWMYDKNTLLYRDAHPSNYSIALSKCARISSVNHMLATEYVFLDYIERLKKYYPMTRHNLTWTNDPLMADFYIIPHDYTCLYLAKYQIKSRNKKIRRSTKFSHEKYFVQLLDTIQFKFPYWNMSNGSNHLIFFSGEKKMSLVHDNLVVSRLQNVIQLSLTGYVGHDYLEHGRLIYRHGYDIILPSFSRLTHQTKSNLHQNESRERLVHEKTILILYTGTFNERNSTALDELILLSRRIGHQKIFFGKSIAPEKNIRTLVIVNNTEKLSNHMNRIQSTLFRLCIETSQNWPSQIYESIMLGSIPIIVSPRLVLPFEKFIDWSSFSMKIQPGNLRKLITKLQNIEDLADYVQRKLDSAKFYSTAFKWPYSSIREDQSRHVFLPKKDLNGTTFNVFHYFSMELRCRQIEELYGATSDIHSTKSILARKRACKNNPDICPCDTKENRFSPTEYI